MCIGDSPDGSPSKGKCSLYAQWRKPLRVYDESHGRLICARCRTEHNITEHTHISLRSEFGGFVADPHRGPYSAGSQVAFVTLGLASSSGAFGFRGPSRPHRVVRLRSCSAATANTRALPAACTPQRTWPAAVGPPPLGCAGASVAPQPPDIDAMGISRLESRTCLRASSRFHRRRSGLPPTRGRSRAGRQVASRLASALAVGVASAVEAALPLGGPEVGGRLDLDSARASHTLWLVEGPDAPSDLDSDPISGHTHCWSDGGLIEGKVRFAKEGISFGSGTMRIVASSDPQPESYSAAQVGIVKEKGLRSGELRARHIMFRYGDYDARMKAPSIQLGGPNINRNYSSTVFVYRDAKFRYWLENYIEATENTPTTHRCGARQSRPPRSFMQEANMSILSFPHSLSSGCCLESRSTSMATLLDSIQQTASERSQTCRRISS